MINKKDDTDEPKKSSLIDSISYSNGILKVVLTTGKTYEYMKVSRETYEAFEKAESKGAYFLTKIRQKYKHKEIKSERNDKR